MVTLNSTRRPAARTRRCEGCGSPFAKVLTSTDPDARTSPCRFCGHRSDVGRTSNQFATIHLRVAFDGMPPMSLHRIKLALNSVGQARTVESLQSAVAPIAPSLASWIGLHDDRDVAGVSATVGIVVDVLHTLSSTSRKHATADQLNTTIVNVLEGRLDQLPLPNGSPCFCRRGTRYADCHGRRAR